MSTLYKFRLASLLALFFSQSNITSGQERPVLRDSLYSKILQETRPFEVLLPRSYQADSAGEYGVVYVLDGEWNLWLLPGSYDFTVGAGFVPDNIFVRIPNVYQGQVNLRDRDLTPTQVKGYSQLKGHPISGGADAFRAFLKEELIPYINQKYPATAGNTLVGGSLAGMFTIHTLLKDPGLFSAYVAVEPALHWDNRYVNKLASETLLHLSLPTNTTLWIAGRAGRAYENMGIAALDSILRVKAPKELLWKSAMYAQETHYSAQYKGYYDGFKFIYEGYVKEIDVRPRNGILLKEEPFDVMVIQHQDSASLRYTTDGSLPTVASPRVQYFIPLSGTAALKIKSFGNRSAYNQVASGSFKEGKFLPARARPNKGTPPEMHYKWYEGEWEQLPDFKGLSPVQAGVLTKDVQLPERSAKASIVYVLEGQVEIPAAGYYVFFIDSAKAARVYVGDRPLIDANGEYTNGKLSFVVPLEKGFYPVRVELLQKKSTGKPNFKIYQDQLKQKDEWWNNVFFSF